MFLFILFLVEDQLNHLIGVNQTIMKECGVVPLGRYVGTDAIDLIFVMSSEMGVNDHVKYHAIEIYNR